MATAANILDALTPQEQQQFAQQLKYAQALRGQGMDTKGQMVSGIYVPKNPWENLLTSAAGSGMERYQNDQQQALTDARMKEYNDFIGKRPSIYTEQPSMVDQAGPPMEGAGPLPQIAAGPNQRVLKSATQMLQDQNDWMGSAGPSANPLLNSIRQQSVTSDLGWPEKMIALEQANAAKAQLAQEKATAAAALAESKAEAKRQADAVTAALKASQQAADNAFRERTVSAREEEVKQGKARTDAATAAAQAKIDSAKEKDSEKKLAFATGLDRLESLVNNVKNTPNLDTALGAVQGTDNRFLPVTLSPFQRSDAMQKIKGLQEYLQTRGLEDLRRAGVAPGSVTEKEWSKFAIRLANINPLLNEKDFTKELDGLLADVRTSRERLASGKLDEAPSGGGGGGSPTVVKRVQLTTGPNAGKTGVLWSNGDRTVE